MVPRSFQAPGASQWGVARSARRNPPTFPLWHVGLSRVDDLVNSILDRSMAATELKLDDQLTSIPTLLSVKLEMFVGFPPSRRQR